MRLLLLTLYFFINSFFILAQTGKDIIAALQDAHQAITTKPCGTDSAAAISQRAMNVFLADKTGYVSASRDLSYYTNYVSFNSSEGRFTVNHNFQQATTGNDAPIKKLLSLGFDITLANSYAKSFLDKRFENEMGITLNSKWLGRVKTRFADCAAVNSSQKKTMDALRSVMLEELSLELIKKEAAFSSVLSKVDAADTLAKKIARKHFYEALQQESEEMFSVQQAALLTSTMNFKIITTHWTSFTAYIPLVFPSYKVAPSFTTPFTNKRPYPLALMLGHTRLWEMAKKGRLFVTLEGSLLLNNAKLGYGLSKMNFSEYKSLGGTNGQPGVDQGYDKLYIGAYSNFITPAVSGRLVYFPSTSHVGLSAIADKSFGKYNLLNCRLGIPFVLINAKKTPAANIECYVLFFDLTHQTDGIGGSAAGLSVGIPFSRLMY